MFDGVGQQFSPIRMVIVGSVTVGGFTLSSAKQEEGRRAFNGYDSAGALLKTDLTPGGLSTVPRPYLFRIHLVIKPYF